MIDIIRKIAEFPEWLLLGTKIGFFISLLGFVMAIGILVIPEFPNREEHHVVAAYFVLIIAPLMMLQNIWNHNHWCPKCEKPKTECFTPFICRYWYKYL